MDSPVIISQASKDQLVASLNRYTADSAVNTQTKYVVIKTSDGNSYTVVQKAHWLILKLISVLHFFHLYSGPYHSASQSDKNALTKDIISILNDAETPEEKATIIQAAAKFLRTTRESLDPTLRGELEETLLASTPVISNFKSYTTVEDYLKLLDSAGYKDLACKQLLAEYLYTRGAFSQVEKGEFSFQEIAEFNSLVRDFLKTSPGAHLIEFLNPQIYSRTHIINGTTIDEIYTQIKESSVTQVRTYNDIKSYLTSCGIRQFLYDPKTRDDQFTELLQYLVGKAQEEPFVLPRTENSPICRAFFNTKLQEFNRYAEEQESTSRSLFVIG